MKIQQFGKPLSRLITMVAICMLSFNAMAYDFSYTHQGKTLYYNITSENTVAVTYYSYISDSNNYVNGDVVIPRTVEYNGTTYSVASIDSWAFDCCYSLTSVSIPNSVTAIGTGAFSWCLFISSINIPEGITSLENHTFYACLSLTDIVIPNTVNTIGKYAFAYCEDLASIQLPSSLTELDTCAFYHCKSLNAVSFPNGLTRIGAWAFDSCVNLSNITLPEGLTTMEKSAFRECSGLQYAELPSSLAVLDTAVFEYCTSLTSVNLPNGLTRIGGWAFDSCVNLSSITLPESLTTIEKSAFLYSGLTSVTIPDNVTKIDYFAFYGCNALETLNFNAVNCQDFGRSSYTDENDNRIWTNPFGNSLTTVNIGNNVQRLPDYFIMGCSNLSSITLPNNITEIGRNAFAYSGLTSVDLPSSLAVLDTAVFAYCASLTSVSFPNGLTRIGAWAFDSCVNLSSITLPESLTTIELSAFRYSGLTSVTIPDNVTEIDGFAFYGCNALTEATIGESVTTIGEGAFWNSGLTTLNFNAINCQDFIDNNSRSYCAFDTTLTTVNIGDSVQRIPANFVSGCSGLTEITIPENVPSIGNNAFAGCSNLTTLNFNAINCQDFIDNNSRSYCAFDTTLTTVNIGDSVQRIPANFVSGCSGLTEITIPENVPSIGNNAFAGCSNLTTLNFNAINCRDFGYGYNSSSVSPFGDHLTTVNIGDSVQRIPSYFVYGNDLTEITIPEKVEKIGGGAFCNCGLTTLNFNAVNCQDLYRYYDPYLGDNRYVSPFDTSLTTINIGNSVQRIPYYFVVSCHRLTSVTIPKNVTSIRNDAFINCGLTTLNFNAINCQDFTNNNYYGSDCPFDTTLTTVNIGDSVQRIPANFVSGCSGLTEITIPENVTTIGNYAFYYCTGLPSSLTIPKNVTSIGDAAFVGCGLTTLNFNAINCQDFTNNNYYGSDCPFDTTLTTVNIGDSVQRIPANFARNCGELTSIEFPVNIHTIGGNAFDGCKSLTSITIPEMVDTIYSGAFANCDSLTTLNFNAVNCNMVGTYYYAVNEYTWYYFECSSLGRNLSAVNIGNNVQRIPDNFLLGCTNLDSIIIPSSVTTIGSNAFNSCTGLTSISLPEDLTSIGGYAFSGCSGLTSITIPNGVTSIEPNTFYGCTGLASINLPEGLVSIGDGAFANCSSLSALTIPSTVSSIGSEATGTGAFSGCTGLSSITSMAYYSPILSNVNTFPFAAIRNIPVHIPCGSSMNYRYAAYWNSFINIQDAMLYQLDLLVNDTTWGSATYSCAQFGTSLTAIPKNGATFVRWNDGYTENPRTVTITTDTTFTAIFGGHATYTVSVEPNNPAMGSVTGGGTFDDGSATTISATPFTGYHFVSWSDGNTDNPRTVTVESNITYTAVFAPNIYSVTAEVQNPSMGSVNGGGSYNYNSNVTLTAMPNSCSRFVSWTDGNTENPRTITVISDTTLTAVFEGVDYAGSITAAICEGSTYAWNGSDISEAGTYTQTLQAINGCDSTVTLTLTVNPVASTTLSATICEGSVYTENGFNVSEVGTHTQTLQTINGCDSIVTLTLTVNPVENTNLSAAICEGTTYTENGFNVSEAGVYIQNLQTINGCDSTITLTLVVNPVATTTLQAAICEGTTYTENGFNVSEAGVYTQNLQTINGCDSTVTLSLSVNPVATTNLTAAICEGTAYTENGFNVSEAGVYTQNLQTINGCDSVVTLTLTVNPVATTALQAAICEGTTYTENGFNVSEAGVYTQNLQTINGCDSTVTLTLVVNPVATTTLQAAICEGTAYTENGFNVSEAGVYTQNLQTINGCDSIVTLTLTVNPVATTALQAAICEGTTYTENGFNVSEAGVYTQNLQTINGCDSTVTLTLTVNPVYIFTIDATINQGETYQENGFNVSEAGTYTQNLQTVNGCDSVIVLNLTVNSSLGDVVANTIEVALYPNPAENYTVLKVQGLKEQTKVALFDVRGRKLREFDLSVGTESVRLDLRDLPSGVYTLMIGNTTKKLIVE